MIVFVLSFVCLHLCGPKEAQTKLCLATYFVLKLVQEGLLTATPLLTNLYFGWGTEQSGTFLAVLGCLILPLNFLIGSLSRKFDDRTMMLVMQIGVLIGMVVLLLHTRIHTVRSHLGQFAVGGVITFSCSSMLEGVTMSLLSKVDLDPFKI